jgi:hypothetical protein
MSNSPGVLLANAHFNLPLTRLHTRGRFEVPLAWPGFLHDPPRLEAFTGLATLSSDRKTTIDTACFKLFFTTTN